MLISHQKSPLVNDHYRLIRDAELPRACQRMVNYFDRCKMVNGSSKCSEEVKNVMEVCPAYALESRYYAYSSDQRRKESHKEDQCGPRQSLKASYGSV